ncbi:MULTISPECIES: efflux RND transporter periplasmic adaptor subunit [Ramlibacter]|uniref:Efflux RND transporter periplasmic adaptor subunit n=1 Tax=Ramlibacter pinisoli TaxID=2682844 RepID=A0A6N8IXA5_9BURK|nr:MULTISPECIES: efflux RND transporter periplasmic adaptor subunit [Ramlibacter]MBA2961464.1 efflux RND transporter periplasmic adaptor subunit [Ramlibacter sp. CGMCC 1.13660]MVQ31408.1 efflux RND transporter periplasmic adaptor subunit [Ramlibacter pinisoli]
MPDHVTPPPTPVSAPDAGQPPPRRYGRRGLLAGSLATVLVVAALGAGAWYLTRSDAPAPGQAASGAGGAPGGGAPGGAPGGPGGPGASRGGPPTTVGVAVAERGDLNVTLEALGTVVPAATVRVRPQVSGPLQQVLYKEGQMVRKGDLLATIDPRPFEMAVQQASGQRLRDEAQLEAARVTLQRFQTLLQLDSIARQEVDTQAALVKQLEATVVVDKANEGTARLNLAYTRIAAPVSGRVGLRTVDVGNMVSTSDTNGVAVITQLSPIDVQFSVPQDQVNAVLDGAGSAMAVRALDRTRTQLLDTGTFGSLDNLVDAQTGTVKAKARFANADGRLFPSQFVNVQLQLRTLKGATLVPVSAVRAGPNGDQVFVLNPDRTVSLRLVQRGQSTVDKIQIVKGLEPGERVITEGADRLRDGSRVTLPGEAGAGRPRGGASGARPGGGGAPQDAPAAAAPQAGASSPAVASGDGSRRSGSDAPGANPSPSASPPTAATPAATPLPAGPTPAQRQRMLESAQNDPEQLERRKRFLEALDRGDPQALERWQQMQQRARQGGGGAQ